MKKTLKIILSVIIATILATVFAIESATVSAARNTVKSQTTSRRLVITEKKQYSFNVRTQPSITSNPIGKISNKDFPIDVLGTDKDSNGKTWYQFKFKEKKGWVISSTVLKVEEKTDTSKENFNNKVSTTKTTTKVSDTKNSKQKASETKYVQANGVTNVRQKPELGKNIIAKWYQTDTPQGLKVLEEKIVGKMLWYKVPFNGKYGWCQSVAVKVIEPETSTTITTTISTTKKTVEKTTTTSTKNTNTSKTSDYGKKMFSSSYSTNYGNSNKGRKQNIKVTCDYLDGLAIKPGEEFNWFTMMPTTTKAHGYTLAGVFQNGKTVQGMGGGLCQVTSTLYNVCLDLEEKGLVKITARKPHGLPVSYVPPGRDATISRSGKKNFCFKDTSDCILVISAKANGRKCTVTITGYEVKNKKK